MKGHPPNAVEQRIREGNPRRHPIPEPLLVAGRPEEGEMLTPPEDLPPSGKEAWNAVVPQLAEVGLLDRVDRLVLEAMCLQWARMKQAGRVVAAQGHLIRGPGGTLREHPALRIEREAASMFFRFAEQYAMTPIARTRLGLAELHRRQLKTEFDSALGTPDLVEVDIEDAQVVTP
jgi:P27 family predicted phage terminase small subunit